MKWEELRALAKRDHLDVSVTSRWETISVTISTTDGILVQLLSIVVGNLTDEDGDVVVRKTIEAALCALKELSR